MTNHVNFFSKNDVNDNYLRPHAYDILTNHNKILTNLTLTVAENDCLTADVKGHYYPHAVAQHIEQITSDVCLIICDMDGVA